MNRKRDVFSNRYYIMVAVIFILMSILGLRLFMVTVLQHDRWEKNAENQSTKLIYQSAPRGDIFDRNGKLIAGNRQMFTVAFNSSSMDTEQINKSAYWIISLMEKNGDKYDDDFSIKISKNGNMYYTFDDNVKKWLKHQKLSEDLTAKEAFHALRARYGVPEDMSRYKAYDYLTGTCRENIPINVRDMHYIVGDEKYGFLAKWGCFNDKEIEKGISAEECFKELRKKYSIPKNMSNEGARKIFIVRNEIASCGFRRYSSITLAKDVSASTIAQVEEANKPGVSVVSQYKRYYPGKNTACHILGYMGNISEDKVDDYVEKKGYSATDLIGQTGIEAALESQLHGRPGVKKIRVNSSGEYVDTISESEPKKGRDAYLTIDLDLQKATEQALKTGIAKAGARCQSGAVVALDVKTGDVISMASYPGYDPSIFANGITSKAWKSVQSKNPRDSIAPSPLYNNATMAAVAPGSTFKPITAVTALEKGLNPDRRIVDHGFIEIGGHKWGTSLYNAGGGTYGPENLEWGLGHSSNYYFNCIGTGKDWGTGGSLGYKISVDDIIDMAGRFGLGHETGIELPEAVAPLPSRERKIAGYRMSCWQDLYVNAHKYFPRKIADNYDKLTSNLNIISAWVEKDPTYQEMVDLVSGTDVKKSQVEAVASKVKYDYCTQAKWTTGDQLNISIGQGDNAYTPLQMASYLATLGDNGVRNRVSLIYGIEGRGTLDRSKSEENLKLKPGTIPAVEKGMKRVCTDGTLKAFFSDFRVPVAGKTGTAENQGVAQPPSEVKYIKNHLGSFNASAGTSVTWNQVEDKMIKMMREAPDRYPSEEDTVDAALRAVSNYKITNRMINSHKGRYDYYAWTMTMAPADNPRIAVVTLLIQGGMSSKAAPVNKAVLDEYFKLYGGKGGKAEKTMNIGKNEIK